MPSLMPMIMPFTTPRAARAVGLSRYAYEIAREYCETRKAFGKPIGHFQAVAFALTPALRRGDENA